MMKMLTRTAFVLALLAISSTTFVIPAHAATRLLEVRNKSTDYILHFTVQTGTGGPKSEMALIPGGTWGISQAGMYWVDGYFSKAGTKDIPLQKQGILLKDNQGVLMILWAGFDNVGTHTYRWFVYNQR